MDVIVVALGLLAAGIAAVDIIKDEGASLTSWALLVVAIAVVIAHGVGRYLLGVISG